jgi:hypothetical protein
VNAIIVIALLAGGYYLADNWLISEFGVVKAWQIKQNLISAKAAAYAVSAIAALYIAAKFKSAKVLLAGIGVIAAVPFCLWLRDFLGHQYFLIVGKVFFYALVSLAAAWGVAAIAGGPVAFVRRLRTGHMESAAEIQAEQAKALKLFAEAKNIVDTSRYSTASGPHVVVLDHHTGKCRQYIAPPKPMFVEEEDIESEFANLDATQIFDQIYQATDGQQNCPSLIIAGEKRSGKSKFAEYITHQYADEIDFVVIDPKQADPKINWGPTTRVIGQSQNWQAISDEIDGALEEIKRLTVDRNRRKQIYLMDEWLNLLAVKENKWGEKTFMFMNKVLTELSYLGIGVIILPHATTATALGFKAGYAQLKSNFDGIFRFEYSLFTNIRKSFFEFKGEEIEIQLWNPRTARRGFSTSARRTAHPKNTHNGPFGAIPEQCASAPESDIDSQNRRTEKAEKPAVADFYESKKDKIIVEAHRAGESKRSICDALKMSSGGTANAEINRVLKKYGISAGV